MAESESKVVMVAVDDSECSQYALEWALQNIVSKSQQKVILFNVQPISDYAYLQASTFGIASPQLISSYQENQKKFALALLDKAKAICSNYGVVAETMTVVGDPKDEICEAVEKFNIQLLVLGSHSRSAVKRVILGSVSNYCVHNAKCPVLVVKKPL